MSSKPVLKIDWATHDAAKYACENWHYSKCIPKSKFVKIGAWENGRFIGVVIYSYGANQNLASPYGLKITECVELTRIALDKHISNVSKIIAISLKFLKSKCPGLRLIVSYADLDQGHHGGIYQASNWIYAGCREMGVKSAYIINGVKTHPKTVFDRYGTRSEAEIRKRHSNLTMFVSKGKHVYVMPLDDEMRRKVSSLAKPYPKCAGSSDVAVPDDQSGEGGSTPTSALQS